MKFFGALLFAFVILLTPNVSYAQQESVDFCFNSSNGQLQWTNAFNVCAEPFKKITISLEQDYNNVCILKHSNGTYSLDAPKKNNQGKEVCVEAIGQISQATLVPSSQIAFSTGGGTGQPSATSPQPTTPTPSTTPSPKPDVLKPTNNSTNATPKSTGGSTANSSNCPSGFTAKGPLCVPNNPFGNSTGILGSQTVGGLATSIISILLTLAGMVAVVMVIFGGYQMMTAAGNEEQAKNGRKTLINALIGLVLVVLSYVIVQVIINFITSR